MTIPERQTVAVAAGASQADALRAIARRLASDASANHGQVKASTLVAQLGLPNPTTGKTDAHYVVIAGTDGKGGYRIKDPLRGEWLVHRLEEFSRNW